MDQMYDSAFREIFNYDNSINTEIFYKNWRKKYPRKITDAVIDRLLECQSYRLQPFLPFINNC